MYGGKIKNIFFDFDGVILDSVNCKTEAFVAMYSKHGNKVSEAVKDYHLQHGGVSRFEKFRYWHKQHLGIDITDQELDELTEEFSQRVVDQVVASNQIEGAIDFIKQAHDQYKFWIITGTPTNEIKLITDRLGISQCFLGIFGSPEKKKYWVDHILNEHKLDPKETLFLGDAMTDYEAAQYGNLNFALREASYNIDLFKDVQTLRFETYDDLKKILNE